MTEGSRLDDFEPASGRLFLCIELPEVLKRPIRRLQGEHRGRRGIAWIEPEKLHLTLRFLGPRDPEFQEKLARELTGVVVQPFLIALQGLGVFPQKGPPSVLWAGLAPVDPRLFQLYQKLEALLMALGVEPERRRYRPHVTLARCTRKAAQEVSAVLKKSGDFETAPFLAERFALYASQLSSAGSIYTKLLEVPLGEERSGR